MKCDKRWLHCGIHWHQVSVNLHGPDELHARHIFWSCSRNSSGAEIIFEWITESDSAGLILLFFGKF